MNAFKIKGLVQYLKLHHFSFILHLLIRLGGDSSYLWASGDTFKGNLEDGLRTGWGLVTSPENDIVALTGEWVGGSLEGKGRLVSKIVFLIMAQS